MPYCFNLDTKETLPEVTVRELLPNLLLPENGARWFDSALPWAYIYERDPVFDPATQSATAIDPVKGEDGVYVQSWVIEALSQEVLDERAARQDQYLLDDAARHEAEQVAMQAQMTAEVVARLKRSLDVYFDSVAKEQGFENGRTSLVTRAAYPNKWQGLATAFGTWMDECNDLADTTSLSPEELIASFTPFTFK